ncbi:hypothetical protein PUN28_006057 [Cardiocondyla obscurior]|uniref:Uncharacterized protein n=1 Tax=Cardiocondyla obscurior TaxID=286306 RepID=A0AAW2GAM3_9HYME
MREPFLSHSKHVFARMPPVSKKHPVREIWKRCKKNRSLRPIVITCLLRFKCGQDVVVGEALRAEPIFLHVAIITEQTRTAETSDAEHDAPIA